MSKPERAKFATRRILLRGEQQRGIALSVIANLPIDGQRPLEMMVREAVRARGPDQNGYYFLRIGEITEQAWVKDGEGVSRQFSKDAWHEYAKKHIMPEVITTKDGDIRSKWEQTPDGSMSVISTTRLERGCFAEYTTAVEAFGAGLGVQYGARE